MKILPPVKQYAAIILLLITSHISVAQTKLVVTDAKVNMVNAVYLSTADVSVSGNGLVNAGGSTIKVAGSIASQGLIDVRNGTLEMNGTAAQEIPANSLTDNLIKNLTVNSTNVVTVGGPLALTDVLTLSAGSVASDGTLTLKSISTKTARVAPVTSNASVPAQGNIVVERYNSSRRSFRFLTPAANTSGNVRANWMENTNNPSLFVNNNPVPGYGTHITGVLGNANGFDVTATNNPSLFTFDNQTGDWIAATNTNSTLKAGTAYRILIRGSRSTNITQGAPPSSVTTLRSTGTLVTGTVAMSRPGRSGSGMPELSAAADGYSFIGNPYAAPVDWLLVEKTNISTSIYIWDPTLSGENGRGAYVTYNSITGISNISSAVDNNLQSGQAFFIQNTALNSSVTFREIHKSDVHRAVFRVDNTTPHLSLQLLLPSQTGGSESADGLSAYFSNDFDSAIRDEDSHKFTNLDENLAILRNGILLSIEGRKPVTVKDTLPLKIWQLTGKNYFFKAVLSNFTDADAYLEDIYLHADTKLNNEAITLVPFSINNDSASFASNRFKIVFKPLTALAVTLSGIKAYLKNDGVQVDWTAESEINMDSYTIEKSSDAQHFSQAGLVTAKENSNLPSAYSWFDSNPFSGNNYYRIKSVSKSGETKYSKVAKVYLDITKPYVYVVAGQAKSSTLNITFKNVKKGNYTTLLINNLGQKIHEGSISHAGGSANQVIQLENTLSSGIYHLQVSGIDNFKNIPVLIQ